MSLTAKGRGLLEEPGADVRAFIAPMARSLTAAEQKRLGVLLHRVLEP